MLAMIYIVGVIRGRIRDACGWIIMPNKLSELMLFLRMATAR